MSSLPPPPALNCYRHPGRETGRLCTRCGRPACGDCLVQAAIGSHCVECVKASRPAAAVRVKDWNAGQFDLATKLFFALNIAVFIYLVVKDTKSLGGDSLAVRDLAVSRFALARGEWWRLFTSGLAHYGLLHLAFNSLALWRVGPALERAVGPGKFAAVYVASMLAGGAGAVLLQPNGIAAGASGAVFGLFGAIAMVLQRQGVNPMQTSIGSVLLMNLAITFLIPGISIGGHLGGLVGGGLCGLVLASPRGRPAQPQWLQWAVPVAVGVGSILLAFAVSG